MSFICIPCPNPCAAITVSCNDVISVIIQSILNLGNTSGSTADAIVAESLVLCSNLLEDQILSGINTACSKGILFRNYASLEDTPTYYINAYMCSMNVQNSPYSRFPCSSNSFFQSSVSN